MRFLLATILFLSGCATSPNILEPVKTEPKVKRLVVWNKKQFLKPKGGITMNTATLMGIQKALGGKNLKALPLLNGFTVEVETAKTLSFTSDEWVVQPEYEHHILQQAYTITPYTCPATPTCPVCPNPGPGPSPTPIETAKSWGITRVHANEAKALVDTSNVKVCVVDDGADFLHPNVGRVIASQSYTGEPVSPGGGHGQHTSGTVAGTGGIGVSRAQLLICKGLGNSGSGSSSQLAQCLTWCGQQGAQIVSNSWGSNQSDPLINQAIQNLTARGIAVVVANGNDSRGTLNWPAALAQSNALVFGVAASDQFDRKANFSTYGPGTKFIAPGVDIVSSYRGGLNKLSGTSMAAPHVAGLMAYCVAVKKPFQSCLKTDLLGFGQNVEGAGLPRGDLTVQ